MLTAESESLNENGRVVAAVEFAGALLYHANLLTAL